MKFLFSSSDAPEIEFVQGMLVRAGIQCEVLHSTTSLAALDTPIYPELWIKKEDDFLPASMLFASRRRNASASPRAA